MSRLLMKYCSETLKFLANILGWGLSPCGGKWAWNWVHAYRRDPHHLIAIIWQSDTKVGSFSQLDNNRFLYGLYIYLCMTCYETVWFGTVEVTVE